MPRTREPAPPHGAGILVARIVGILLIVGVIVLIIGMIATNDLDFTRPGVFTTVVAGAGLVFVMIGGFGASMLRLPSPIGGIVALCILWIPGIALTLGGVGLLVDWTNFSVQRSSRLHRWIVFTHGEVVAQGWGLIGLGLGALAVWAVFLWLAVRDRRRVQVRMLTSESRRRNRRSRANRAV